MIEAVTFLSPNVEDHLAFERVTFSPSQKGHKETPGGLFLLLLLAASCLFVTKLLYSNWSCNKPLTNGMNLHTRQ